MMSAEGPRRVSGWGHQLQDQEDHPAAYTLSWPPPHAPRPFGSAGGPRVMRMEAMGGSSRVQAELSYSREASPQSANGSALPREISCRNAPSLSHDGDSFVLVEVERGMWRASESDLARNAGVVSGEEEHSCAICLEHMDSQSSVVMRCGHCIHIKCALISERHEILDKALHLCPECRGDVSFTRVIFVSAGRQVLRLDTSNAGARPAAWADDAGRVAPGHPQETENQNLREVQTRPTESEDFLPIFNAAGVTMDGQGLQNLMKSSTTLQVALSKMLDVRLEDFKLGVSKGVVRRGAEPARLDNMDLQSSRREGCDTAHAPGVPAVVRYQVPMAEFRAELMTEQQLLAEEHQAQRKALLNQRRRFWIGVSIFMVMKVILLILLMMTQGPSNGPGTPKRPPDAQQSGYVSKMN